MRQKRESPPLAEAHRADLSSDTDWETAFKALLGNPGKDDRSPHPQRFARPDPRPIAELLRRVMPMGQRKGGEVPVWVLYELANLFDPVAPWSRFYFHPKEFGRRLRVVPLTQREGEILSRNQRVLGTMLRELRKGESVEAAAASTAAEKGFKLSERQVLNIWSQMSRSQPYVQFYKEQRERQRRKPKP
jgi:hypothetical protein